ncbi:MAG: hypothetical protein ACTSXQ_00050, partial [Alphaproteobacteria bacterium]
MSLHLSNLCEASGQVGALYLVLATIAPIAKSHLAKDLAKKQDELNIKDSKIKKRIESISALLNCKCVTTPINMALSLFILLLAVIFYG